VHHTILFQFRLSSSQSIGPRALRRLWSRACQSADVSVQREIRTLGFGKSVPTYALCGPSRLDDLPVIEARLRHLLAESGLVATFSTVRPS